MKDVGASSDQYPIRIPPDPIEIKVDPIFFSRLWLPFFPQRVKLILPRNLFSPSHLSQLLASDGWNKHVLMLFHTVPILPLSIGKSYFIETEIGFFSLFLLLHSWRATAAAAQLALVLTLCRFFISLLNQGYHYWFDRALKASSA